MRVLADTLFTDAGFPRTLALSAAGHLVVMGLLLSGLALPRIHSLPAPVYVDLVAPPTPPRAKSAARASAPRRVARHRPRQRVVQPVLIPRSPPPAPKARPKAKPKVAPAPRTPPRAKSAETPQPAPPPTADEILAQLRARVSSRPETAQLEAPGVEEGRFDPLLARYQRQVLARLRANWTGVRAFQQHAGLRARYQVRLDASGALREVTLARGSGNPFFDESAERAIRRADPYPRPPRGALTLDLTFEPGGVF